MDKDARVDEEVWRRFTRETESFYDQKLEPITFGEIIAGYTGNKKKRYERAREYLCEHGLQEKHARIQMFVKNERFPLKDIKVKPPRAIQYRTPEYNLVFMKYTKPFEDHYYPRLHYGAVSKTRVIAKGMNNQERAEVFMEKCSYFARPVFYCMDYSAFDSTIMKTHLLSTHRKYIRVFGKRVKRIARMQIKNKGVTRCGIKYEVQGTRMSGDADTGLGNCIVNLDAIYAVLKLSGIQKYDMLIDGDDAVIIVEQGEELDVSHYAKMGLVVKAKRTDDIHQVDFCQSRLVFRPEPLWVRNPKRAMSNTAMCKRHYPDFSQWLASCGECELAVNYGVPILMAYGSSLSTFSNKRVFDRDLQRRMELAVPEKDEVTDIARLTFYQAFGTPPPLQIMLEEEIAQVIAFYKENLNNVEQLQRTWTWSELGHEFGSCSWWCGGECCREPYE